MLGQLAELMFVNFAANNGKILVYLYNGGF